MAIRQKPYKKDRSIKKPRVVPFTVYLDPCFDRKVRVFAKKRDLTLTQIANRAIRLFMETEPVSR